MVNVAKNRELTAQLKELYERVQPAFLDEHEKAFGHRDPRINEYGIISEDDRRTQKAAAGAAGRIVNPPAAFGRPFRRRGTFAAGGPKRPRRCCRR